MSEHRLGGSSWPDGHEPLPLSIRPPCVVIQQDAPAVGLRVVVSGLLVASRIALDGRVLALDLLGPGDVVGEPAGLISPVRVEALTVGRLRPAGLHEEAALLAVRGARAVRLAGDLASLDVTGRVRRRLAEMGTRFGQPASSGEGRTLALPLTQDLLAALCGTSRESANRALARLEATGAVRVRGRGRYLLAPEPPEDDWGWEPAPDAREHADERRLSSPAGLPRGVRDR